jgi:hypothetical protein
VRALLLADGPARYFGGSIESFALPMALFILIAVGLYLIFKRPHSVPRMKYLTPAHQTSVGTREPGTPGVTVVRGPMPASVAAVEAQTAVPGGQAPHASETVLHPDVAADAQATSDEAATGEAATDGRAAPSAADKTEGDA